MPLAILMLFAVPCKAQEVKIVEKLADGSYVVSIGSVEYRALGAEKMRELQKQKIDLDAANRTNEELNGQVVKLSQERDLLKKDVEIANLKASSFETDLTRTQEDSKRNFNLWMQERDIRIQAQQFIPHSQGKGFWNGFLKVLDSQGGQTTMKLAVPLFTAIRSSQCAR